MKINKIENICKINLNLKKDNQEKNHQNQDNKFEKELKKQKKLNKN